MSSAVVEAIDVIVVGFDKTVGAVTGVFKKEGETGTKAGPSGSNDKILQQDQDKL